MRWSVSALWPWDYLVRFFGLKLGTEKGPTMSALFMMVALETPRFHSDSTRYPWCEKTNIYKRDIRNCSQAGFLSNTPMVECINRVRFWLVASVAPNTRDTLLYHCARHLENGLKFLKIIGNLRSSHSGSRGLGARSWICCPCKNGMTSSSMPWITSVGLFTFRIFSMLNFC